VIILYSHKLQDILRLQDDLGHFLCIPQGYAVALVYQLEAQILSKLLKMEHVQDLSLGDTPSQF
jgi:hypothetical protein